MSNHPKSLLIEKFHFRTLHQNVFIGTTTDRYAGWIRQIYSKERYQGRISRRTHTVGGKTFVEEVLPVDSVREYFEHFPVLEIDFTFYRPLLEKDGRPTQNYHVLPEYRKYLREEDQLILKVPQLIFAQKLRRGGKYVANEAYLNTEIFTKQFYKPAIELLGSNLSAFIFEQEYQRKQDRSPVEEIVLALDEFFGAIPADNRYHVEIRTESYLTTAIFNLLEKHGVGQVLSHWTWLPSLRRQFSKAGSRIFNSGSQYIIRLLTPRGMKYEESYAKAHPFDRLVEGMLQREMVEEASELLWIGVNQGVRMNVLINNRAGGNAPMIAQQVAQRFLELQTRGS
jgi:uncharacterized protein YecE (DUF72 family)